MIEYNKMVIFEIAVTIGLGVNPSKYDGIQA